MPAASRRDGGERQQLKELLLTATSALRLLRLVVSLLKALRAGLFLRLVVRLLKKKQPQEEAASANVSRLLRLLRLYSERS